MSVKPFMLIILDGWGYREDSENNAIQQANTPNWDALWQQHAHTLISGSGQDVGLPGTQMGNSEVGHVNLGAGRVVYQSLTRIDRAIQSTEFEQNTAFCEALAQLSPQNTLHIMGLVSDGGVHSHISHIEAAVQMAAKQGIANIVVHAFLDGRDTPPQSAKTYLSQLADCCRQSGARIASVVGRYYAMDRDKRWERVQAAYDMLTKAQAPFHADSAEAAVGLAYDRGETDEFVQPTLVGDVAPIAEGDVVFFMNFRADRARQLTQALVCQDFSGFERDALQLAGIVTLAEYEAGLPVAVAYPPEHLDNVLGEWLSKQGLKQLRCAETEKYAHVTFFFNGGVETPFSGEDRELVASPKVATYDLQPEMSAPQVTEVLCQALEGGEYDAIICNYANADMVGHTGNLEAAIQAIEAIDHALGQVVATLEKVGGQALITADHGNAELMKNVATGQPHTAHTNLPVPLIYVGGAAKVLVNDGVLSDVAPTMLQLMGLPIPDEMTGRPIFALDN